MRVLICPDKFAGTLSAAEVGAALRAGWLDVAPTDEIRTLALADGGPGFLDVLLPALGAEPIPVATTDPFGRPVAATIARVGDTAYVESAQACGLHLVAEAERDPDRASTAGVGTLVTAAIDHGARRIVVGLGGSATVDGGLGLLAALGVVARDAAGRPTTRPAAVVRLTTGDTDAHGATAGVGATSAGGSTAGVELVAAADVDNPLTGDRGAAAVFGPQKGVPADRIAELDAGLGRVATLLAALPTCPPGLADRPGGGAAGGLGAALFALGAVRASGITVVADAVGLAAAVAASDIVLTGEGSFDAQSLEGKVVAGVAAAARARGVACVVVAGRVLVDATTAGVERTVSLVDHFRGDTDPTARALRDGARGLTAIGAELARHYHP